MSEARVMDAIRAIIEDTGFPPDLQELVYVTGLSPRRVQSSLNHPKRRGELRYDEDGCFVIVDTEPVL